MYLQSLIVALALFRTSLAATSSAGDLSIEVKVAAALGVSQANLNALQATELENLADLDVKIWTHLGDENLEYLEWSDDVKLQYLTSIKSIVINALDTLKSPLSKRAKGTDSPAARAQVEAIIAKARADHDSSHRRHLLQCANKTQFRCTACAAVCSATWVGKSAGCGAVALGAETATAGTLTPAVSLALAGCITVVSSDYASCILGCTG